MATIEKLMVQIFDRKRQVIDQLHQQKLLYDQHLASKLLIQGITPPSWLLPDNFPPSSSDLSDKAGLISGLLHLRREPVAPWPGSHDFLYNKPVSAVNDSVIDEECTGICVSSTRCKEDDAGAISVCNVDDTEDRLGVVPVSHAEVNACRLSYAPMSPEKQSHTGICDTQPKLEQSLVKIERSRSRQKALEIRRSAQTSGKSQLGMNNSVDGPSRSKSCQEDEKYCGPGDSAEHVRSFSLSTEIGHMEEATTNVRSPTASGCLLTLYPNEEVKEAHTGDNSKGKSSSVYVGGVTRSSDKSRQFMGISSVSTSPVHVAPLDGSTELIKSDKAFALPSDTCSGEEEIRTGSTERIGDAPDISPSEHLKNIGDSPSANKSCQGDEEVNDLRDSLEPVKPASASAEVCFNKEVPIRLRSSDSGAASSTQFANTEANEVHAGDNQDIERRDSIYTGRITRSSGFCQQSAGDCSGSKKQDDYEHLDGSTGYKASALPTKNFPCEEVVACSMESNDVLLPRDLGLINNVGHPSGNHKSQDDEQLEGPKESLDLMGSSSFRNRTCDKQEALIMVAKSSSRCKLFKEVSSSGKTHGSSEQLDGSSQYHGYHKPSTLPSEICSWEEEDLCLEPCLASEPCDAINISLMKSQGSSTGKSHGSSGQLDGSRQYLGCNTPSALPTEICSWKEDDLGPYLTNETRDAVDISFRKSAEFNAKDVETLDDGEEAKGVILTADRTTTSTSGRQSSLGIPSSTKASGHGQKISGIRDSLIKSAECKAKDGEIRVGDDIRDSLINSAECKAKDGEIRDVEEGIRESLIKSAECKAKNGEIRVGDDIRDSLITSAECKAKDREIRDVEEGIRDSLIKSAECKAKDEEIRVGDDIRDSLINSAECKAKDREIRVEEGIRESLVKSAECEAKSGKTNDDGEETGSDSFSAGRVTTSSSSRQSSLSIPSSSNASGHEEKINDIRESLEIVNQTTSATGNFFEEVADTENRKSLVQHQEDVERNTNGEMTCEHKQIWASSLSIDGQKVALEPSDCYSKPIQVETVPGTSEQCDASIIPGIVNGQEVTDNSSFGPLLTGNKRNDCERSPQPGKKFKFSIVSPVVEYMDVDEADQTKPEFERFEAQNFGEEFLYEDFSILSNIMEHSSMHKNISTSSCFRTPLSPHPAAYKSSFLSGISKSNDTRISVHEQQYRSACLSTPLASFPASGNLGLEPGIYSSVPNGLLENFHLQSALLPVSSALQRKSHSDLFSFPHNQCGVDIRKPFQSPVENGFESIASTSASSVKVTSGNPELTCFTIMEDPESSEEDVNEPKIGSEGTDLSKKSSSSKEPLRDISVKNKTSLAQNQAVEKNSLESVSTEIGISETCDKENWANGKSNRQSKRTTRGKENKGVSAGGNSLKRNTRTLSSRISKPKLSGQSNLKTRGQSLSENEPKRNNIVSNVKSFIPLVQQKQAAAAAPVKRDVKVKALEAAEAAKRIAEKKENERKQKKEALKNERERLEQEKLKQLELAKKLKEDAKKKRDAENAAKKRQRAEEEKIEKEKKRQRVEDARCQQKQAQEKLQAWREESRYGAEEERIFEGKELYKNAQNESGKTTEASTSSNPMNELVDAGNIKTKAVDGIHILSDKFSTEPSHIEKVDSVVAAESSTPNFKSDKPIISQNSEEQSYDISPYQCSDDEEEEDEEIPNKKFIPSWASKSCVSQAIFSLNQLDPDTIFPPGSFCNLDEVLVPKGLPLDSKKR